MDTDAVEAARHREEHTAALYVFARQIAGAAGLERVGGDASIEVDARVGAATLWRKRKRYGIE